MAGIELRANEDILGKGECSMMMGPLGVIGELTLTNERLHFEPNRLNRLVGVKPLTLQNDDIDKLEIVGIDRVITITSSDTTTKFMGKWAKAVHDRLLSLRSGEVGLAETLDGFAVDERYLIQTDIDYSATSVVMVGGDVIVTARHIRFTPSGLEKLMWRKLKVEAAIEDITDLALSGPRRLQFQVGDDLHRFAGAAATRVYAAIWAAQEHINGALPDRELVFELTPASMQHGVLAHPGLLVQTRAGLSFLLGGSLDALVGAAPISHFLWQDVSQLDIRDDGKMVITTESEKTTVSISDLSNLSRNFLVGFAQVAGPSARVLGLSDDPIEQEQEQEAADEIAGQLGDTWGDRLPNLTGQTLALWGPALRVSRKVGCRRGHVAIFDEYVLWVPEGGTATGLNPIALPISQLQRADRDDSPGPDLRLHLGDGELQLMPATQQRFTAPFWELLGTRAAEITLRQRDVQEAPSKSPDVWNRRSTYRVGLPTRHHIPLQIRVVGADPDKVSSSRLIDLSLGGGGTASADEIPVGTHILIAMARGQGRSATFRGTVIHSRRAGRRRLVLSGIEFTDLSPVEEEDLRRLWTACQRIEVQLLRGMEQRDISSMTNATDNDWDIEVPSTANVEAPTDPAGPTVSDEN